MDDETLARMTAKVIGPNSGAAKALALLERRRAAGEDVAIFEYDKAWYVGPKSAAATVAASKPPVQHKEQQP